VLIAVLGCGLIGASWAALFSATGGHRVSAWDPAKAVRDAFQPKVDHARRQLLALGAADAGTVKVCDTLEEALASAEWVQENAPEILPVKARLLTDVESLIAADAVIASSTSSLTWSQLSSALRIPGRLVIAHPFNPPHLIPLVELFCPDAEVLNQAVAFFSGVERVPVCLKREATGHIGNRLASALWREAVNIVAEGIADVSDVDRVLIHGPGLRWSVIGTHMGYHLGGGDGGIDHYLEHLGPSQEQRWASLGAPRLTPQVCEKIARGVHEEAAGRSIAQLEAIRDRQLIAILQNRRTHATLDATSSPEAERASEIKPGSPQTPGG
jgi:3-hydroxyacyl-CoA dehydrogenase